MPFFVGTKITTTIMIIMTRSNTHRRQQEQQRTSRAVAATPLAVHRRFRLPESTSYQR